MNDVISFAELQERSQRNALYWMYYMQIRIEIMAYYAGHNGYLVARCKPCNDNCKINITKLAVIK